MTRRGCCIGTVAVFGIGIGTVIGFLGSDDIFYWRGYSAGQEFAMENGWPRGIQGEAGHIEQCFTQLKINGDIVTWNPRPDGICYMGDAPRG